MIYCEAKGFNCGSRIEWPQVGFVASGRCWSIELPGILLNFGKPLISSKHQWNGIVFGQWKGWQDIPFTIEYLYTKLIAISSNAQRRHLSLFLPQFASNLIRSSPAYFGRVSLTSRHTVENNLLRDTVLLIRL